jgi:RecG-like helicase
LKVLEKSSDGFHLANADLVMRGPGNLLGKKQSGHLPEFPIARLEVDGAILQEAHLAAVVSFPHPQNLPFPLFLRKPPFPTDQAEHTVTCLLKT